MDRFVFDLDGTLITFPVEWEKVRAELTTLTGTHFGTNPFFLDFTEVTSKSPDLGPPMLEIVDSYEALSVGGATLNEGAKNVLTSLSKRTRLALVTMQGEAACGKILKRLGMEKFFVKRFTREFSMDRVVQLEAAVEALGSKKSETVFVGDRRNDLRAAREVGVRFVMIRSQQDSPPADALYRSMAEFAASPWIKG